MAGALLYTTRVSFHAHLDLWLFIFFTFSPYLKYYSTIEKIEDELEACLDLRVEGSCEWVNVGSVDLEFDIGCESFRARNKEEAEKWVTLLEKKTAATPGDNC